MTTQTFTGQVFKIDGFSIPVIKVEPCYHLIQIGKGLPLTCACSRCEARKGS